MNENETVVETAEAEQTSDAFLSGWDDNEPAAVEESDQTETNAEEETGEETNSEETEVEATAEEHPAVEETAEAESANQQNAQPMTIPVDYMGEHKEFNREEAIPYIQKGMDYDRIRGKYDEMKPLMDLVNTLAQKSNMPAKDYITELRKQVKMADGADAAAAAHEVDVEDREARIAAAEEAESRRRQAFERSARERAEADARVRADAQQFKHDYPNVKMNDIPKEVWDKVQAGYSLVSAYSQHMVSKMQADMQNQKQAADTNRKNADRSTGSQKSAGQNSKSRDPFLEGW